MNNRENIYNFHKTPNFDINNLPTLEVKTNQNIYRLFKENKWANYFDTEINELRYKIFTAYIQSDKTLQQIKTEQE